MTQKESVKNIPIADVCNALNIPLIRHGNSLQSAQCPAGHESRNGNCFSLNTSANFFQCFSCGIKGDSIKLVEITKGLTFTDSMKWLAETFGISDDPNYKPVKHDPMTPKKAEWIPKEIEKKESDNQTWQTKALSFISYAENELKNSPETMEYLIKKRFLTPDTVKHFRIGYNPKTVYIPCEDFGLTGDKVLIPKGVVIPYIENGKVLRLRIRKGAGDYHVVRGSHTTPYQIENRKSLWIIVESDSDGLLIHQDASDMVNVCALGSTAIRPDTALHDKLMKAEKILCSLDSDQAGIEAYHSFWKKIYPNLTLCPCIDGKDICEMVKAGIPIRLWLEDELPEKPSDSSLSGNQNVQAAQCSELPVKSEKRTWCIGYLQGNCEFVSREAVMQCRYDGIRKVIEMSACPLDFWARDEKGFPICPV